MSRFVVYAPDGEMFEVPATIARKCIIEHGWSITKPQPNAAELPLFQFASSGSEERASTPEEG